MTLDEALDIVTAIPEDVATAEDIRLYCALIQTRIGRRVVSLPVPPTPLSPFTMGMNIGVRLALLPGFDAMALLQPSMKVENN